MSSESAVVEAQVVHPAPRGRAASSASFLKHAKLISGLTLASRVLGLGREIVAGHYLGTGLVASAFTVAFTIPNLFRKLFGEGALSAAFIPLYTQAVKREREQPGADPALPEANAFAAAAVNMLCALLLGITVAGEVGLLALLLWSHEARPERLLLIKLTAIMLPYVVLICGGAFLSGILQVHKRFGPPAAAPIILNAVHIGVLLVGAKLLHLRATTPADQVIAIQTTLAYWLAGFVLLAGVLQVMVLWPALRAVGFSFQPILHFWTPAIRRMLWMSLPVAMGAGVLQLSVLLDKGISMALMQGVDAVGRPITHFHLAGRLIAYPMEMGAPRRLDVAQFLYQFPLGIFAIALATAIFPHLSSEALEKDRDRFRDSLRRGIEAALWEGLPASAGLVIVRLPAVRLLFQHGQVHGHDAELIASSVFYYAMAIWAFSVLQIVNRAYYAIHDTVTPFVMSMVNIALNLIVEIPLLWWLGESAMAVGTAVSFAIQAVIMTWMLNRKIGGLNLGRSARAVLKMILATAIMALACEGLKRLAIFPHGMTRLSWAMQVSLQMAVGAAVYLAVCSALGVQMLGQLRRPRQRLAQG